MYIQRIHRKDKGKVYTSTILAHSYRENGKQKRKTIANLTGVPPDLIEILEAAIKGKQITSLSDFEQAQGKSCGALLMLMSIAQEIGLDKALGKSNDAKLAMLQIMARIIDQGSRLSICDWAKHQAIEQVLGIEEFTHHHLYDNLDWINAHQEKIENYLFHHKNKTTAITSIYLYDVTSSYLEGNNNELAQYGYNRDKKKGKKQLVIGLLCDKEGDPVSVEVFEGNTGDTKTFVNQLQKLKNRFGLLNVITVGDKGMIKQTQIEDINDLNYFYITTITRAQIQTLINKNILQLSLFEDEIMEVEHIEEEKTIRYIMRRNPMRSAEIKASRASKIEVITKKIEQKNEYLNTHTKASASVALVQIKKAIDKLKLSAFVVCTLANKKIILSLNNTSIEEAEKLDGCYVVKSNVEKKEATAKEIHDRYKDLAKVEFAFRTIKTTLLEIRPLFLRKENRTRAHVLVCMLAYKIVWKLIQKLNDKVNYTTEHIIQCMDKIQYTQYTHKNVTINKLPTIFLEDQQNIITALNLKIPKNM